MGKAAGIQLWNEVIMSCFNLTVKRMQTIIQFMSHKAQIFIFSFYLTNTAVCSVVNGSHNLTANVSCKH